MTNYKIKYFFDLEMNSVDWFKKKIKIIPLPGFFITPLFSRLAVNKNYAGNMPVSMKRQGQ